MLFTDNNPIIQEQETSFELFKIDRCFNAKIKWKYTFCKKWSFKSQLSWLWIQISPRMLFFLLPLPTIMKTFEVWNFLGHRFEFHHACFVLPSFNPYHNHFFTVRAMQLASSLIQRDKNFTREKICRLYTSNELSCWNQLRSVNWTVGYLMTLYQLQLLFWVEWYLVNMK
jgi:hypothetical protein